MDNMIIKPKTVVEQVMEKIKELIASGQFGVNDQIPTEAELAQMFGIGRSSIREAIKVFNYLGILESRKAKGTFVCDRTNISTEAITWSLLLGKNDIYEIIEMRESIELWCLMALTERYKSNPDQVEKILETLETELLKMRLAVDNSLYDNLIEADYNFHSCIINGSGNTLFSDIYEVLRAFMYEEINTTYQEMPDPSSLIGEHREFIDAIKSGEISQVQTILVKHISVIKSKMKKALNRS